MVVFSLLDSFIFCQDSSVLGPGGLSRYRWKWGLCLQAPNSSLHEFIMRWGFVLLSLHILRRSLLKRMQVGVAKVFIVLNGLPCHRKEQVVMFLWRALVMAGNDWRWCAKCLA